MKKYFCQRRDELGNVCGQECKYIRAAVEYAVLDKPELTRKPVAVKRDIIVECPIHGKVTYEHFGHHVTNWKEERAKKRKDSEQ